MDYKAGEEFKGFGEGFDGFPKHLPEDCVEYTLFIIDSKLHSQKEIISRLEAVRREASKLTDNLLKDYIWQRDAFKMELKLEGQAHLYGMTNFGDSVEDEWLIVYILRELTNHFPNSWVKVVDNGGEFLLIQAANALPRWLTPEVADNRVWIHQNQLRIIPLTTASSSSSSTPSATRPLNQALTLPTALSTLSTSPQTIIHSPLIESEAFYCLRNYPSQISSSLHHALLIVPRKLAYILHSRPAAIAPAVEAFYLRDPIALKPLQSTTQGLVFHPENLITLSVRFTKVLYAQVVSQHFAIPPAWQSLLSKPQKDQKLQTQVETGMKVTSGFEMLLSDRQHENSRLVREIKILLDDLDSDPSLLPSDEEIEGWKDSQRQDGENWLNIDFDAFEKELDGKPRKAEDEKIPRAFGPEPPSGFGEKKTQEDLRRMVKRFEDFLNDEEAGMDGAEVESDDDGSSGTSSDDDSEEEDKEVSFDEKEFARLMREMMGMPSEEDEQEGQKGKADQEPDARRVEQLSSEEEEDGDESQQIREVMQKMEAELNAQGTLDLDPAPSKLKALKSNERATVKGKEKGKAVDSEEENEDGEESDQEEVDIDFNLAKNMLESFRSQVGMAGPGGNMMNLMGVKLPRDEDDEGDGKREKGG